MDTAVLEKKSGTLFYMDKTGDTRLSWDSGKPDEVAVAERTFDDLLKKGYMGYSVKGSGKQGDQIRKFDPNAEAIIMAAPLRGG